MNLHLNPAPPNLPPRPKISMLERIRPRVRRASVYASTSVASYELPFQATRSDSRWTKRSNTLTKECVSPCPPAPPSSMLESTFRLLQLFDLFCTPAASTRSTPNIELGGAGAEAYMKMCLIFLYIYSPHVGFVSHGKGIQLDRYTLRVGVWGPRHTWKCV